ncbi:hypothetical protein M8J77_020923 [Diaphorina citri]|nr:hypothetical protein M8J77_003577 [Diaphorina citri]KAI5721449.1 hypothetical protein M8J77_020923 [Diaphorina citri]
MASSNEVLVIKVMQTMRQDTVVETVRQPRRIRQIRRPRQPRCGSGCAGGWHRCGDRESAPADPANPAAPAAPPTISFPTPSATALEAVLGAVVGVAVRVAVVHSQE